jgi:outer membrane protein assembly factor BamB/tetratricopeptide (TPR) repeat protein
MSMPRRARVLVPCLAALLALLCGGIPEGTGQPLQAPAVKMLPPDEVVSPAIVPNPVVLTTDPLLRRKLDAARDYIKAKSWAEAVRLLQGVLDAREDGFLKIPQAGARGKEAGKWVSARVEAERLLAGLPPAGREFYQLTYEGAARALLARARAGGDRAALHEAARRFRFTRAGAEALALLGNCFLDRGQPDLAAACFQRLLEGAERDSVAPAVLFQAAVAFRATGNQTQEEPAWIELTRRLHGEGLRLGKRTLAAEDLRRAAQRLTPAPGPAEDWLLYRGDSRRAAAGPAVPFLLEPSLSVATAQGEARQWLQRAVGQTGRSAGGAGISNPYYGPRQPPEGQTGRSATPVDIPVCPIPGAVPLAVGGRIVYRGADGIHALDADSGREVWQAASPLSLDALLREPGKKVQLQHWFGLYGPARAMPNPNREDLLDVRSLLYENSTLGTLASDGRSVYAVEDVPLPPSPELILLQMSGQTRSLGPLRNDVQQNRLRAIDLATGQVRWEVGGPRGTGGPGGTGGRSGPPAPRVPRPRPGPLDNRLGSLTAAVPRKEPPADPLADAFFLGPPLPLGGDLFALVEKQEDLALVCLDPERGDVRWTQSLAVAGDKMMLNVLRRTQAAHLAYGDGVLVCPTHSGAVLAVDPLTRSLLWAHVYREPPAPSEGEPGFNALPLVAAWKGSAPIVRDGRVVFTAPDSDAVWCLRLRDGALLWKALKQTENDLYVAGVLGDRVLVVGRTACRALSLAGGQVVWQRTLDVGPGPHRERVAPAGQGVAAGSKYYLPLTGGAVLALDVEDPHATVRIEPRSGSAREYAGNLVFHRGVLWSQSALQLTAYLPLEARLARVEDRLAAAPRDGAALAERGRLRLAQGDMAGAAADLHAALDHLRPEEAADTRVRLFGVLGQLLQRNFAVGEKYLDDYRRLCALVPLAGRPPDAEEQRQRRQQLAALVARGRESQGRVADALHAYADLLDHALPEDLLTVPEDPALRMRPEVWTRGRVAAFAKTPCGSRLHTEIERRWQDLAGKSGEPSRTNAVPRCRVGLTRFLALFGSIADGPGAAVAREARLRWARELAESPYRAHAIDAELLLHALENELARRASEGPQAARALEARARLLLRQGLLGDAADCYRRLGSAFSRVEIEDGKTGADVLAEAALDKRLLTSVDLGRPPQTVRWPAGRMKAVELPGKGTPDPMLVPLMPRIEVLPASPGSLGTSSPPPLVRGLRFFLDGRALQLLAVDRDTGAPRFAIPLPLTNLPAYLRSGELPSEAVDHLLLVAVGPTLLGIDLLERRVRWSYNLLDEVSVRGGIMGASCDGTVVINTPDGQSPRRMGWVGPAGPAGVLVHNRAGLTCLDTASGTVRWVRCDVPAQVTVFGDGERLYLAEHNGGEGVRGVRAVRLSDGMALAIPDATAAYAHRLRVLGRRLLVSEEGPNHEVRLRLYDLLDGKDVWSKEFPADSVVLSAPRNEWVGVAAPDGAVTVLDLATLREGPRLAVERQHLNKVTAGVLLADARRIYVALQGPGEATQKIADGPNPWFRAGIASATVNGMLYAFDRAGGELCWYSPMPAQCILLERFDELPLFLCAATLTRQPGGFGEGASVVALRSIDKQTGKVICNKESPQVGEPFHTLQIDPRAGTVDLIGPTLVLRHQAARKP